MNFEFLNPYSGIEKWNNPVFDAHIHIWDAKFVPNFLTWVKGYYKDFYMLGMAQPDVKKAIEEINYHENIIFAYYMGVKEFGKYAIKTLDKQVDEARKNDYSTIKLWFAPRMVDYAEIEEKNLPYKLIDRRTEKIFSKIEENGFKIIIHVADPDIWYYWKYYDKEKYGAKIDRLNDFSELMKQYPKIIWISAHFGSWPENLSYLGERFDEFPSLYVDTGSTRWIIRELSKKPDETSLFFQKYADRILFGSDLSIIKDFAPIEYWATRFWSHKRFWENNGSSITTLAFRDDDSPFGLQYKSLGLPKDILEKIYYQNSFKIFNLR